MSYYKNPSDMENARADKAKKYADEHYSKYKESGDADEWKQSQHGYREEKRHRDNAEKHKGKNW